jgi:hypothetical protein
MTLDYQEPKSKLDVVAHSISDLSSVCTPSEPNNDRSRSNAALLHVGHSIQNVDAKHGEGLSLLPRCLAAAVYLHAAVRYPPSFDRSPLDQLWPRP